MRNWAKKIVFVTFMMLASVVNAASVSDEGLHLDWIDTKINPKNDFFSYANGNWQKKNPIPGAYASWGTFHVLHEQNIQLIKSILETASKNPTHKNAIEQKVGDFYLSGMDDKKINALGIKPLQSEFDRINHIQSQSEFYEVVAHLHQIGVNALFSFGPMQDYNDSNQVIGAAFQGGLSLPDRDYYLDTKFRPIRQAYEKHMKNLFQLLGDSPEKSSQEAVTMLHIETVLAKASLSRIALRDPHAIYHPMTIAELDTITPHFSWENYFTLLNHPTIQKINLATPHFFSLLDAQLTSVPLDDWKVYLRGHLIESFGEYLSQDFVDEDFHMTSTLTGAQKLLPRWERVVNTENELLGFAIGKLYVEKAFPPSSKMAAEHLIADIRNAMKKSLNDAAWMTPKTRYFALEKLNHMEARVGYPIQWRDYSSLEIDQGPYVSNVIRALAFHSHLELNKIDKPVDRNEWDMTPQTVNAYYEPSMNMLNIPAGILQPPFFDPLAPPAVNYGAIGFVIGHEMTHGFDDQGAQFDRYGNLKNWWTQRDLRKFKEATDQISHQYSHYTVNGHLHVQGKLVTGEASADLGGLNLAYRAFHASSFYPSSKVIDGFTPDQQFFIGAAHVWAMNMRPEALRLLITTDPHPPAIYRVNGTFSDMLQFQKAFHVTSKDPMANKIRCYF